MSVTIATITGGIIDPYYGDGDVPITYQFEYGTNEYVFFNDRITVNLDVTGDPSNTYTSIDNVTVDVNLEGFPVTQNDITANGAVTLNLSYSSPTAQTTIRDELAIVATITSSEGNIDISGNIQNAFPDKYWQYKNFGNNNSELTVSGPSQIPDENIALHLYKPSFMRYVSAYFDINVTYSGGVTGTTVEYTRVQKRVLNNWEINRLALLSQIQREEAYRSNNYPY